MKDYYSLVLKEIESKINKIVKLLNIKLNDENIGNK